jgi:hypothetical protein
MHSHGAGLTAARYNLGGDPFLQLGHCAHLMPALGAVNVRSVGVIFLDRKAVVATLGAVELDTHRYG